jgi:hypothetical protein
MEILQAVFWKNDRDKKLNLSKKRDAQERAANRGVGPPLWMAARRCACSSAEGNSVQSHSLPPPPLPAVPAGGHGGFDLGGVNPAPAVQNDDDYRVRFGTSSLSPNVPFFYF